MKKIMLIAAAAAGLAFAATTGSAFAQYNPSEAFISQVGNGHNAANIQVGQDAGQTSAVSSGDPSTAVIVQSQAPGGTNGHIALQVQLDPGNAAYTFQSSTFADDQALTWQDGLGVAIWAIGVAGEAVADAQLARFRADPGHRGRTCRAGLWRYSRHPNYFFEWLTWWAYVAIAWGAPHGWVALFGPAVMLLFLFKVTGIPYTEAQALRSRGDDYRAYQRTTSAFVPWFPRADAEEA